MTPHRPELHQHHIDPGDATTDHRIGMNRTCDRLQTTDLGRIDPPRERPDGIPARFHFDQNDLTTIRRLHQQIHFKSSGTEVPGERAIATGPEPSRSDSFPPTPPAS
jgi:hypothetical protein